MAQPGRCNNLSPGPDLEYIINHVFLPSKLPQGDDHSTARDSALVAECLAALNAFQSHFSLSHERAQWDPLIKATRLLAKLCGQSGERLASEVEKYLATMADGDVLPLHVRGQNAGLIVRRLPGQYSFESFELSPPNEAVTSTKGRLRRSFPGPAIAINRDRIVDLSLRKPLAQFLASLDADTPLEVLPTTTKAGTEVCETRDTVHPRFVTEMLTSILRAIGQPIDVTRIHKSTREEILWSDAARPWRRSPLWLFIRIALQSSLVQEFDTENTHLRYKSFMIFCMAHILKGALGASSLVPSDVLFIMVAKISRRALKLGINEDTAWWQDVQRTMRAARKKLTGRWSTVENNPDPFGTQQKWQLSQMSFPEDTKLKLSTLRPYLAKVKARKALAKNIPTFSPNCPIRILQSSSTLPDTYLLTGVDEFTVRLSLTDLEYWVQHYLEGWVGTRLDNENTCAALADVIHAYTRAAASTYANQPEDLSIMLLTSMDLWVALDKCAVRHCPLLLDYAPGFPQSLFEPLLLPKKSQLQRLFHIEQHLEGRRTAATLGSSFMFESVNNVDSFSVRYFNQSSNHQELRRQIEAEATSARSQKLSELSEKRERYQQLLRQSVEIQECESVSRLIYGNLRSVHSESCKKCLLKAEASAISIGVYEWPLPTMDLEAKSAVFALSVPSVVSNWRDTTYMLLVDIFSPSSQGSYKEGKLYHLQRYSGLATFAKSQADRLQYVSTLKPFTVSHYRSQKISVAHETSTCANHGLSYTLYDATKEDWTKNLLSRCDVRGKCTPELPSGPYKRLQYAVNNTKHSSNEVISKQAECPQTLSIHEFYAFATLRSGHRLQWRNIARELVACVLNFNREETHTLVVQAAWQAGPPMINKSCRDSHVDLEEEDFCKFLLSALSEGVETLEGNWQAAATLRTYVVLVSRLLSFSTAEIVQNGCSSVLRRAREIALRWSRDLSLKLREAQNEKGLEDLNLLVLEMALTCHATFDVDQRHLPTLLDTENDIAVLIQCSIMVHDRCPPVIGTLPASTKNLLRRHWRLSRLLEPELRKRILALQKGVDQSINQVWAGYRPGKPWSALNAPNQRWLRTETSNADGSSPMIVHYNVLDGSLLVNGFPLSRLPATYETHPSYHRLFGKRVLDVVPSTISGMLFEAGHEINGNKIHFGVAHPELIIRAAKDNQLYELLPLSALGEDFPQAFIQDYSHWLDIETEVIEWRPLSDIWTSSPQNWTMHGDGQGGRIMIHGAWRLIDVHSSTAQAVSSVLMPLESRTHLHIVFNPETKSLKVQLPRFKLDFFLEDSASHLESQQFRGMKVDSNQSFGAFTGLANKLVLRSFDGASRSVIVPHGQVQFEANGNHVRVSIGTGSDTHLKYHLYQIDSRLSRLVHSGNLTSSLFKCYLHALTAHCLPDELTKLTGTEQALLDLAAASVRSSHMLGEEEISLLTLISQLTPRRTYYPQHLKSMQKVEWQNLSPLSQHNSFCKLVGSIFQQARTSQLFHGEIPNLPDVDICIDLHLLERASVRNSVFCVHGFGAEDHTTKADMAYTARHCFPEDATRESQTYCTAKLVDQWSRDLKVCPKLLPEIGSWNAPVQFPHPPHSFSLGYDIKWLDPTKALPSEWCLLQTTMSGGTFERERYRIMIFLCTLAYSQKVSQEFVQTVLAFATVPELRQLRPPNHVLFNLEHGYEPKRSELHSVIQNKARPYNYSPESRLPQLQGELWAAANDRRMRQHQKVKAERVKTFVDHLINQWPEINIQLPSGTDHHLYIRMDEAINEAKVRFQSWHRNVEFQHYIGQVQKVLNALTPRYPLFQPYRVPQHADKYVSKRSYVDFNDIANKPAPFIQGTNLENFESWIGRQAETRVEMGTVQSLLALLSSDASGEYEQRYTEDLLASFETLYSCEVLRLQALPDDVRLRLADYLSQCSGRVDAIYNSLCGLLEAGTSLALQLASEMGMWPRLSPSTLLRHLASDRTSNIQGDWKYPLVEYGLSVTALQRAERLIACAGRDTEFLAELANVGHEGWNPMDYPEWLLFEIENKVLIRQVQAQIALEMISPSSGKNSVLQLNMGEGKSSVIIPIVAAALANGSKLLRVVVLKPLSTQMFHLLVQKLGGMLNRRIFRIPISRSLQLDVNEAKQILGLYEECMQAGGILLVQPEHLLSFQLLGLDRLLSGQRELGNILIQTQLWLENNSRDVLDESDEILNVRFELIYAIGIQHDIEFSPDRWVIVEQVLGLVSCFARSVLAKYPDGLEVQPVSHGGFPRIRILQHAAGDELMAMVAREICDAGLQGVPVWNLPEADRDALFRFLTEPSVSDVDTELLQERAFSTDSMRCGLLLLKGLIADGILTFALEYKRWRVNYGLDPSRTMLAVPYRAKDTPATRAEFSHTDVNVVLTCLCYYYSGLSDEQLHTSFEVLLQCDHAQEEFENWIRDVAELPTTFRRLTGINLSDRTKCSQHIFLLLRYAKGVIDFYMSQIVFPKGMKEFPNKLSTSGWDLARDKVNPTTGFSGTNDNRDMLPVSVTQCNLPEQLHTNAAQLECLLRPENSFACVMQGFHGQSLDAQSLLNIVIAANPPVRVILDVGARVLELSNVQFSKTWLSHVPASEAQAVVFFDDDNELSVLSRDGSLQPFMTSPFAEQMGHCLVYLDEAHTRGTDLRLPSNYRAAVTLGPNLTKDRLVQACMRMRKLGKGQSVLFCAPMEVQRKILERSGKSPDKKIEVLDVLWWSISETWKHTRRCIPLWVTQGQRFQRQLSVYASMNTGPGEFPLDVAESLLEPDTQTLEDRYGIGHQQSEVDALPEDVEMQEVGEGRSVQSAIQEKCREFGITHFGGGGTLQDEQERELAPENEQERQVERPPALAPCKHSLHDDVKRFIDHDLYEPSSSNAFLPAFSTLANTSARQFYAANAWPRDLLVTVDFARTVQASAKQDWDSYLRPVHWIVSCKRYRTDTMDYVVVSPYEANELLPHIRKQRAVTLHVYTPRTNNSMRSLEDLSFCAIPAMAQPSSIPPVITQLNLFAGQLYLRDYDEYISLCRILGLCYHPPSNGVRAAYDGFINPADRADFDLIMEEVCRFKASPLALLRILTGARRKGQGYGRSHMGRILGGELLASEHF